MNTPEFIQMMMGEVIRGFQTEVEPLTPVEMAFRPSQDANSIVFLLWHATRTQDNGVHRAVSGEAPLWEREEWYSRFGLKLADNGNGFNSEQVAAFHPDKAELLAYCRRVWEVIPGVLNGLTEEALDMVPNPERPEMTAGRMLGNMALGHSFWHLGDIRFLKGLQGRPFGR